MSWSDTDSHRHRCAAVAARVIRDIKEIEFPFVFLLDGRVSPWFMGPQTGRNVIVSTGALCMVIPGMFTRTLLPYGVMFRWWAFLAFVLISALFVSKCNISVSLGNKLLILYITYYRGMLKLTDGVRTDFLVALKRFYYLCQVSHFQK